MQTEIEVKFVDVDIEDIRSRLEKAGAKLEQPMRLMRRVLIEEPHHQANKSYIRIRDEGDKTTVTFKQRESDTLHGTKEIETTVGDFDTMIAIFEAAGWSYVTYQETRRETWQLGECEVVLNQWPWLEPEVEIEGNSEEEVRAATQKLGFNWDAAVFGSIDVIYKRDYPSMTVRGIIDVKEARFDDPVPKEFLGN